MRKFIYIPLLVVVALFLTWELASQSRTTIYGPRTGINTNGPTTTLEVKGDIKSTGTNIVLVSAPNTGLWGIRIENPTLSSTNLWNDLGIGSIHNGRFFRVTAGDNYWLINGTNWLPGGNLAGDLGEPGAQIYHAYIAEVIATNVTTSSNVIVLGKLGVGTASPSSDAHLVSAGNTSMQIQSTGGDSFPNILLQNDARTWGIYNDGSTADGFLIYDATAAAHRLRIDAAGMVRIDRSLTVSNGFYSLGGNFRSRFATNASWTLDTNFFTHAWTAIAVAGTVILPNASTCSNLHVLIKDEGGNCGATNLVISGVGATYTNLIDGATTSSISANFGAKNFYSAGGTNWWIY